MRVSAEVQGFKTGTPGDRLFGVTTYRSEPLARTSHLAPEVAPPHPALRRAVAQPCAARWLLHTVAPGTGASVALGCDKPCARVRQILRLAVAQPCAGCGMVSCWLAPTTVPECGVSYAAVAPGCGAHHARRNAPCATVARRRGAGCAGCSLPCATPPPRCHTSRALVRDSSCLGATHSVSGRDTPRACCWWVRRTLRLLVPSITNVHYKLC